MKLPADIAQAVIATAAREVALMLKTDMEGNQLVTLQQAADLLGVSKATAKTLAGAVVDLGPQSPRIELSRIKHLIESRRVPA